MSFVITRASPPPKRKSEPKRIPKPKPKLNESLSGFFPLSSEIVGFLFYFLARRVRGVKSGTAKNKRVVVDVVF